MSQFARPREADVVGQLAGLGRKGLDESSLSRLAERLGIEPEYRDTAGRLHRTPPETARRLAAVLGVRAATEMETVASLEQLEQERWREVLPPVVIGYDQETTGVAVRAPIGASIRRIQCTIDLEGGGAASEEVWLPSLPVTEVVADFEARRLTLPILPIGYHRLHLSGDLDADCSLIVAPRRCFLPEGFRLHRFWGVAAQLYALRSAGNWGMGDFGDLQSLAGWMTTSKADTLGIEPLHTLNLDVPESASPYSPSSRLHLNPLYLDVTAIPGFADCEEARAMVDSPVFGAALRAARDSTYVDYATVASLKLPVLECLHRHFLSHHAEGSEKRNQEFHQFVDQSGPHLKSLGVFQALTERFETHIWTRWPVAFRNPASEDVEDFARIHAERVSFFQYLQWLCELQLADAAGGGAAGDMRIGLYRDLAVGIDVCGANCWAEQALFASEARIGAPPDPFNEAGQEWGLVPFNPRQLRASGYAHFITMLRSNMRNAGALRIDHIMGWRRLFLIPAGSLPIDGAYVRFPMEDLLAIAALESHRNHCIVIGEDLGTVPDGFRERMADANILSFRVLYFERDGHHFRRPDEWPDLATVSAATHDLATLRGFWSGEDIQAKARAGVISSEAERAARVVRAHDIEMLKRALSDEHLLPDPGNPGASEWTPDLTEAVHSYLARSRSRLLIVQLADLLGVLGQANLAGTTTQYPNWRSRVDITLEDLVTNRRITDSLAALAQERGASSD